MEEYLPTTNSSDLLEANPVPVPIPATTTLTPSEAPKKKLSHEDYTVGWICALEKEAVPATLMLDEEHEDLQNDSKDNNSYFLGRMGEHNVVIALLPYGSYGEISAATVATDMLRSYRSIRFGLMVGIGAGIPSKEHQIRLGDVVVSAPDGQLGGVVQYDLGKEYADGTFTRKGHLNRPPQALLTAISKMKVNSRRKRSMIPSLLAKFPRESVDEPDRLEYPGREHDCLFQPDYECQSDGNTCESCDKGKVDPRTNDRNQVSTDPVVHYGIIASGNRLVRRATLRDQLKKEYNACCIEMEAAGLMNTFPCLVIRGICDYADSHKNDLWQEYAALTATACARELLGYVSPDHVREERKVVDVLQNVYAKVDGMEKRFNFHQRDQRDQRLLDWLPLLDLPSRHDAIRSVRLKDTGQWFLEHPHFREWRSAEPKSQVLCCFGEPGAGKTIITSLVIDTLGEVLENSKSKVGLAYVYCNYKEVQKTEEFIAAIVKQLLVPLNVIPEEIFRIYERYRKAKNPISLPDAREMLRLACAALQRVYICVDALDELEERDRLLESLQETPPSVNLFTTGRDNVKTTVQLRFEQAMMIQIKANESDVRNLIKYEISESRKSYPNLMDETLEHDITKRVAWSTGNFLLSAHQIKFVLNADTKSKRRSNLEKLPASVSEAFAATIERIQRQSESMSWRGMQILTWVYLAEQLLSVEELLHALATEKQHTDLDPDNFVDKDRFLDNCLGLVIKDEQTSTVRLVHKSLQDYLGNRGDLFRNGHDMIAQTCLTYLMFQSVIKRSKAMASEAENPDVSNGLALVEYAGRQWGHHLRKSGQREEFVVKLAQEYLSMDQQKRYWGQWHLCCHINHIMGRGFRSDMKSFVISLSELHIAAYFGINSVLSDILLAATKLESQDSGYGRSPLSWAALNGHEEVVRLLLEHKADIDVKDERYGSTALHGAAENGHEAVIKLLVEKGADVNSKDKDGQTPLRWAAKHKDETAMRLLIENGADVDSKDIRGRTLLWWAAGYGHKARVKLLIEKGADVNSKDKDGRTLLWLAWKYGDVAMIKLLVEKGADIDSKNIEGQTLLSWAAVSEQRARMEWLIEKGADVNSKDRGGQTPLLLSAGRGNEAVIKLLIEKDADVNSKNIFDWTPLLVAAKHGHEGVVKLLVEKGADVDSKDEYGLTPLWWAARNGHEAVVRLLAEKGADVDSKDIEDSLTPLSWAAAYGHEEAVKLLIEKGADVNSKGTEDRTPLWWAVTEWHKAVMKLPVEKGADVDSKDTEDNLTPLSWAAAYGHEAVIQLLVEKGADVNSRGTDGLTLLSQAAEYGHEEVVKLLVEKGADVNSKDKEGRTPLSWAAENGHETVMKLLVEKGADVNSKDKEGRTPLSWAVANGHEAAVKLLVEKGADVDSKDTEYSQTPLWWAARDGHEAVVRLLVEKGADVDSKDAKYSRTPLSWAAENGHEAVVKLLLAKDDVDAGSKDKDGRTPLSWAAGDGHEEVVKLLLVTDGVDLNSKDTEYGRTPLLWAAENGHEAVVKLLLEKGADVDSKDTKYGVTPLLCAEVCGHEAVARLLVEKGADVNSKHTEYGLTPLWWAARNGHEAVVRLLVEKGADMDSKDTEYSRTPLWLATEDGHEAVVKLLVEKGADVDSKSRYGQTPLMWAAEYGHETMVKLLVEKGADVDPKNIEYGQTPLSWAAEKGHEAVVKLLVEKGADVDSKDKYGQTPLRWAAGNGHEAVVRLLVEKGANMESKDRDGRTSLWWAARNGHKAIVWLLFERGADVDSKDIEGRTPLGTR